MEYLDVLDEQGNKTGEVKERSLVHRDGNWHAAVHVWVINSKDQLLIQHRAAHVVNNPGLWDISSAGHVMSGHAPLESAVREVKEELGINVPEGQFTHLFRIPQQSVRNNGMYINNEWNDVYLIKVDVDPTALSLQQEETAEVKFISIDELKQRIDQNDPNFVPHPLEYEKLFAYLKEGKNHA